MKRTSCKVASGVMLVSALVAMGGCTGANKAAGTAPQAMPSQPEMARTPLQGKVVEAINAGGYTYIYLEKNDQKKVWVAVPGMAVKVGDEVELQPGFEKGPFTSPSLNRTFDQIIFSGGPAAKPAAQPAGMPSGHPNIPAMPAQQNAPAPAAKGVMADQPFHAGKVVETMNAGPYTYVCLEKEGKLSWAAIPRTEVKLGDAIEVQTGTVMGKWTSPTLKRTFDNIIFAPGLVQPK